MSSLFQIWITHQVLLVGPYVWVTVRLVLTSNWIPQLIRNRYLSITQWFFAPLVVASQNSEWAREQLVRLITTWIQG